MKKLKKFLTERKTNQPKPAHKIEHHVLTPGDNTSPYRNINAYSLVFNRLIKQVVQVKSLETGEFYPLHVEDVKLDGDKFFIKGLRLDVGDSKSRDWIPQENVYVNLFW